MWASIAATALKPIVRRLHRAGIVAIALHDRREHGVVGGQAGDADALALEVAGAGDVGLGEHGGQRQLGDRRHPDHVGALLASQREVVDVHHGEVGAPGVQRLHRIRGGRRLLHLQRDALGLVEAAGDRRVDAGMDGVGGEVEYKRGVPVGRSLAVAAAAAVNTTENKRMVAKVAKRLTTGNDGGMAERAWTSDVAEFLGMLFLVLFICLTVCVTTAGLRNGMTAQALGIIAGAHVIALGVGISAPGAISGAHFNPAVTTTLLVLRKISTPHAIAYIVMQVLGAIAAALVVKLLLGNVGDAANLGAPGLSSVVASKFAGMVAEGLGTFILVWAVTAMAVNLRAEKSFAGLVIGLALWRRCVSAWAP